MWHRLDRILNSGLTRQARTAALCEACGGPLWPDPILVIESPPSGERRRVCSPECLPAVWKKMEVSRQKLSATPGATPQAVE
jgi:hypothetical protein